MFYHVKDLQFNARVSGPDPRFANLLLQQFGGPNGELKAAMQYFVQAFGAKEPYPDKYDLLMDIATEEFSHLEIVGATIQMLLSGVNGKLKDAADESDIMKLMGGKAAKENVIHDAMINPHFLVESAGGPVLTDSRGIPWSGTYVNANGDLSVDLRSNMAAESRAKIVYEYLLKFTDDPYVKETLRFLMTREIAHFQMFDAALSTINPNFPPGVLQGDPRHSNTYFNMSSGQEIKGPWNEGISPGLGETWRFIEDPIEHVAATNGLVEETIEGTERTESMVKKMNKELSRERSTEIASASPVGEKQWSRYAGDSSTAPRTPGNGSASASNDVRRKPAAGTKPKKTSRSKPR
jgi:Mn-containing catalase